MNDKGKALWLGIFIIITLIIIGWLIMFLRPSLGDGKTKMRVLFTNIDKISKGTRVTYAGKPIGEVYRISENPQARKQDPSPSGNLYVFELLLKVDSHVHVFSYDKIYYSTSGLLGEKTIEISPRSTPQGSSPAIEVTNTILIGDSHDKIEETMSKLVNVADSIEGLIKDNKDDFHLTLQSFKTASEELRTFANEINTSEAIKKASLAMEKADLFFTQIGQCGTLGRLLHSDNLYLRLNAVLAQFEVTLSDINRYGLFFQFSGKWQKEKRIREHKLNRFLTNGNFTPYFQEEVARIQTSIAEISCLLQNLSLCQEIPESSIDFHCLLEQVEQLQKDLELYNQAINLKLGS